MASNGAQHSLSSWTWTTRPAADLQAGQRIMLPGQECARQILEVAIDERGYARIRVRASKSNQRPGQPSAWITLHPAHEVSVRVRQEAQR